MKNLIFAAIFSYILLPLTGKSQTTNPKDEIVLLSDKNKKVVLSRSQEFIIFKISAPNQSPTILFDVNQDNMLQGDNIDVGYGVSSSERLCTYYVITENKSSYCGVFSSSATLNIINTTDIVFTIPLKEVSKNDLISFKIGFYDFLEKKHYYPPTYAGLQVMNISNSSLHSKWVTQNSTQSENKQYNLQNNYDIENVYAQGL